MQKVSTRSILKKVNEWKSVASMVPAVYRLFVFLEWENIPEEYRKMYDPRAAEIWNEDLEKIYDNIEVDTQLTIAAIIRELNKKNFVAAFGLMPLLLADLFVRGYGTGALQGQMNSLINEYAELVSINRQTAEVSALVKSQFFLELICRKGKVTLDYQIEDALSKVIIEYIDKFREEEEKAKLEKSVFKVMEDYEEANNVLD